MKTGVVTDLPIAVIDYDNSATSRQLISYLKASPQLEVARNVTSKATAEKLIRTAEVYGFVLIPKNFERDLRLAKQPAVISEFNNSLLIPAGLESKAVRSAVGTLSAGIQLKSQLAKNNTVKQAKTNIQPVALDTHTLSNPYLNYRYYMVPSFLFAFLQIFIMFTTIYVLGMDLKYGTTQKLLEISNNSLGNILLGKLLPYTLWFFLLGIIIYYSTFLFENFPLHGSRLILLLALFLLIAATQAFALVFVSTSKSLRSAMTKGNVIAALSLSISGFTFPLFGMPVFFQWFAQIFPFTHFFQILLNQTQRSTPAFYIVPELIILTIMGFVLLLFGGFKYKKMLLIGKYPSTV